MQTSTSCHHASRFSTDITDCTPTRATRAASTTRPPTRSAARTAFIGGEGVQGTCHEGNGPWVLTSGRACYESGSEVNSGAGAAAGSSGRFYRVVWGASSASLGGRLASLAGGSGTLRHHRSPGESREESLETGTHLVSHLTARHRAFELAPHPEHLVGRYPRREEDHGAVLVGESPCESLHGVEGVPHIEVAFEMDGLALAGHDHAVEQAHMRPSLHSPLDPVDLAGQLRRLIGRVSLQCLAELRAGAADSLRVAHGQA